LKDKKKDTKKQKWCKPRHAVVRGILRVLLYPVVKLKYRAKITKFKQGKGRQFIVVYNHQTPFDQFYVGMCMPCVTYYLATEDIFSKGFLSSIIKFLVAPIPIKKQTSDFKAVMNCKRVVNEGASLVLAPEGNRTYSGKTEYIKPSIAGLVKLFGLPIAVVKIEGGYGVQPRWSDRVRKGDIKVGVSRVIEPEEYSDMSKEDLAKLISEELYVNDCLSGGRYKSNRRAEYLERMAYVCPNCGLAKFKSKGNEVTCCNCGLSATYTENLRFESVDKSRPFAFETVNDWYEYQSDYVRRLDLTRYIEKPAFTDKADLYEVILYKKKKLVAKGVKLSLFGDRIECELKEGENWV